MEALIITKIQIKSISERPDKANTLPGQYFDPHRHALDLHSSILCSLYLRYKAFRDTDTVDVDIAGRVLRLWWHVANQVTDTKSILSVRVDILFAQAFAVFLL